MIETHEHKAAADVQSSAPSVITKGEPPEETLTRGPNRACKHLAAEILSKMPDLKIRPPRRED